MTMIPAPAALAISLAALLLSTSAHGEPVPDVDRIEDLSLDDLLDLETGVASWTPLAARESPGIVTVLTREEIVRSGARDLLDLLRLVPGLDFGVDSVGTVYLGVRGNWAADGKVLLLVDGIEYHETLYTSIPFGNHFPVDQVERVEVIRGPGSAVYGDSAEYAVINVITHTGSEVDGFRAHASYGVVDSGHYGHRWAGVAGAHSRGDLRVALSGYAGQGRRSTSEFVDVYGDAYDMTDASALDPAHAAGNLRYKDLRVDVAWDHYRVRERDGYDAISADLHSQDFSQLGARATLGLRLGERATLTPTLEFRRQRPWVSTLNLEMEDWDYYNMVAHRGRAGLHGEFQVHEDVDLTVGLLSRLDHARTDDPEWLFDGKYDVVYLNHVGYAEVMVHRPGLPVLTAGLRAEYHDHFGLAVAPRLALTRGWKGAHAKVLASRAFRAPGIENLHTTPDVLPEFTHVFEVEAGLRLAPWAYVTANVFSMAVVDPLQYYYEYDEETGEEFDGYVNEGRGGTRGLEAELRLREGAYWVTLSYSLYQALPGNDVELYEVPGHPAALLAFPNHKLTARGSLRLYEGLSVNPAFVLLGTRYGYTGLDEEEVEQIGTFAPAPLLDVQVLWEDALTPGLDLALGAHDLLDAAPPFIQPYNDWHAPLPSLGREIRLRGSLEF